MTNFLLLLTILIMQGVTSNILDCLTQGIALTLKNSKGKHIAVYHNQHNTTLEKQLVENYVDQADTLINKIMRAMLGPVFVFSQEILPIHPHDSVQRKQINILVLWLPMTDLVNFREVLETIKIHRVLEPRSKIFIYFKNDCTLDDLNKIFKILWSKIRGFYTTIMIEKQGFINLYSFQPNITWSLINTYDGEKFRNYNFFSNLPINFHGYKLVMAYSALSSLYLFPPQNQNEDPSGLEIWIIKQIAQNLNMTLSFITTETEFRVLLQDNNRFDIVGDMITSYKADILGMVESVENLFSDFEPLSPYHYDQEEIIIRKPGFLTNWRVLLTVLPTDIWIANLCMFFLFSVILMYEPNAQQPYFLLLSKTVILVLQSVLEVSIPEKNIRKASRMFLTILFFYTIIMTCLFKSSLNAKLTIPTSPKHAETINDVFDMGYIFRLPVFYKWRLQNNNETLWTRMRETGQFSYNHLTDDRFISIAKNSSYVTVSLKSDAIYGLNEVAADEGGDDIVYFLPTRVRTYMFSLSMAPGHPFHPLFERKQNALFESGLIQYQIIWKIHLLQSKRREKPRIHRSTSIKDLAAVFLLYIVLLAISFIAFVGELFLK